MNEGRGETEKTADGVRSVGHRYVERAKHDGRDVVTISAGEVVRELSMQYRVPTVCSALRSNKFLKENGITLVKMEGPPSGMGTTAKYTYRINKDSDVAQIRQSALWALRGAAKKTYEDLGGGEAHLKKEREEFNRP
jgi:hypothetical protein